MATSYQVLPAVEKCSPSPDKATIYTDSIHCVVGGVKVELKVTPLCVMCRFLITIDKDQHLYDSCVACGAIICNDCIASKHSKVDLLCSANCQDTRRTSKGITQ